jgi:hypothetical protein
MAGNKRTKVFDLGLVPVTVPSSEIDMRGFTHATVFIKAPSNLSATANLIVRVEFNPAPIGEVGNWYELFSPLSLSQSYNLSANPLVLSAKDAAGNLYAENRAYPIMPMDYLGFASAYETSSGEYVLPHRMRLIPNNYGMELKVMAAREVG